ncbi:MAG: hypothetical protein QOD00_2231 [Blastocatellia bacterium]|nr:hypothetical protein [Blastocatellia bacterium]
MLHIGNKGPFFAPLHLCKGSAVMLSCLALCLGSLLCAGAQTQKNRATNINVNSKAGPDETTPPLEFKGVSLGMSAEEVRHKLGDPRDKDDAEDFFVFNEKQTAQVLYDKAHKVVTISADFIGGNDAPTPKSIFGEDIEAKPDGSMYKMVRYTKAGCWVSYNRTAGDAPLVTVTIQKN